MLSARTAILGLALAACTTHAPAPTAPTPRPPAVPIQLVDGDLAVFAGDADAAYWAADGAVWTRRWTEPARQLAALAEPALALRLHDGALYAATATTLVALEPTTGAARTIAPQLPPWRVLAIDDGGAWFGTDDGVYRAPLSGGVPEQLARGLGVVDALTTDADAVYAIAQVDGGLVFRDWPQQAIVRIAKADGAVRTLAGKQFGADDPVRLGRRLFWATRTGPAIASVDLDDDRRRVELAGTATRLVTDGTRLLVGVDQEALGELHDGRGLVADGDVGWTLDLVAAPMMLAGDGVLALRRHHADGAAALWWLPRPSRSATPAALVTATADHPLALAVDADTVLYEVARAGIRVAAGNQAVRVVAFDRRRGTTRELARGDRDGAVAVDGARLAYGLDGAVWLRDGAAAPRALARDQHRVTGVALDGPRVWWSDGQALWRSDADAAPVWRPDLDGRGTAYARAPLLRTDDGVVFSELGLGADAIRRAGATVTTLDDTGPDVLGSELVRVGDTLVTTRLDGGLHAVPLAGGAATTSPGTDDTTTVVRLFGGPALHALVDGSDGPTLVDLDLTTGARRRRWGVPGGFGLDAWTATADDTHVYAFLQRAGWLVALPR